MRRKIHIFLGLSFVILMAGSQAFAQYGIFDQTADWGMVTDYKAEGGVSVSGDEYTIQGNGDDIWGTQDEGFFVYTEKTGTCSLSGKVKWNDRGGDNEWAKVGVMMREDGGSSTSRHYWTELRSGSDDANLGDRIDAQWRIAESGSSNNVEIQANGVSIGDPGDGVWLRVSRLADTGFVISEYSLDGTNWVFSHGQEMTFEDSIAFGLVITNHVDNELLAEATVTDVQFSETVTAAGARTFSQDDPVYISGDPITVYITVGGGTGALTVTETPPAGWIVSDISDGGSESDGTITWNLNEAQAVSYVVTPPDGTTEDVLFSGMVDDASIFGDSSLTAPQPIGIFDHHLDVGDVGAAGDAEYIEDLNRYWTTGSGADIWGNADEFHFVYKKLSGAFSIQANVWSYNDDATSEWSKAGLMVRDNLTAGSPHMHSLTRAFDGQYDAQWRTEQNATSYNVGASDYEIGDVRLVRSGQNVKAYYIGDDGEWVLSSEQTIQLTDPVYVGLSITSHDDGLYSVGEYDNLEITLYPMQVIKTIEAESVKTGSSVDVEITVDIREGTPGKATIIEKYQAGTTISGLTANAGTATDDGSAIKWELAGAEGTVALSFTVDVPSDFAESFVELSGTYDDGNEYTGETGLTSLPVEVENMGIFQGHDDIGDPGAAGNININGDAYQVVGSGADIWGTADNFHYLWMRVSGDFTFSIDDPYIGAYGTNPSSNDWQKMGIMVRQELTASSAYVIGAIRSSDQALLLQWRDSDGVDAASTDGSETNVDVWNPDYDPDSAGITNPAESDLTRGGTIKITREDDLFTLWYVYDGEDRLQYEYEVAMTDPIYLGIAVTSHTSGATSQGLFNNPQFDGSAVSVNSWMLH